MKNSLSDVVRINNKFCRSINLNQDINDVNILKTLICPASFKVVFESMIDNIYTTGQTAFTWTGPYGAGKSSLALLLSALMGKSKRNRYIGEAIIGNSLSKKMHSKISITNGWKVLPVVGELDTVDNLICKKIEDETGEQVDDIFKSITNFLNNNEGFLLIIDEMGKCLESAARNSRDIYFYQQLAEFASRTNGRFVIIGILHQSFADYARYLPYIIKDEWIKVQGRYVDMPINTAGEEQVELISRAIKSTEHNNNYISTIAKKTVETIVKNKKIVSEKVLIDRLIKCWPINPIVIILLTQLSRKKFGQNQRSIFSFLSSGEPIALRDFINNSKYNDNILYMPADLFDYIRINLESAILSSSDSKLWHIAIDSLNKCQARGYSESHSNILKTIAVIDLFSSASGIVSSIELLESIYQDKKESIISFLDDLKKLSVIIYKKHTNAYSIYEGSDFDIDKALEEACQNENNFNINKLVDIANFRPIIAKRYYHKYGCLRWFDIVIAPISECYFFLKKEKLKSKAVGMLVILLPTTSEDETIAHHIVNNTGILDFPVVFTIAENARIIIEYLQELLSLEWIQNNKNELSGDSIARREVDDRKQLLHSFLEMQLNKILVESTWYIDGNRRTMKLYELSILVSDICEMIFYKSPIIKSELINREKPSSNANSALYALLKDMVMYEQSENLGIDSFTPERGLYNILLKDSGIHKKNSKGIYIYCEPKNNNLLPLWKFNDEYLSNGKTIPILELYEQWGNKPFGIKNGLFSFLLIAYILTRNNLIAIYRDGIYNAEINDIFVEYIYSNPKIISIRYIISDNIIHEILYSLVTVINEINKNNDLEISSEPLIIAKKLVMLVDGLHPWVLKTKSLSRRTTQFRELIKSSNDPNKLLFDDILKIFTINELYDGLKSSINELMDLYPFMIQAIGILLTSELDIPLATPVQLDRLKERAKNVRGISGNFQIDAFATRLTTFNASFDDISSIISLANNKPPNDWIDLDIENAKKEIMRLCTEFKKAELYTKIKNRPATRQAIAFISKIGGKTEIINGEFDLLIDKQDDVKYLKTKIKQVVNNEKNISLILTALAEISIDYLRKKDEK
jgi:hypothetical protein